MGIDVGKLLADLYTADEAVYSLVSQEGEINPNDLKAMDIRLQKAFDSLLSAELPSPEQRLRRVEYLLEQINRNSDDCGFMKKLTDAVMNDFQSYSDATGKQQPMEKFNCGEHETDRFYSIGSQ